MPVITDYKQLKQLSLTAIENYLPTKSEHSSGYHRAKKMQNFLQLAQTPQAILAVLRALFEAPSAGFFGWKPGRSSNLAHYISIKLISGRLLLSPYTDNMDNLHSLVFSNTKLQDAGRNCECGFYADNMYTFVHKLGVRTLLDQAMTEDFSPAERKKISTAAARIREVFADKSRAVDGNLLPATELIEVTAATAPSACG